MSTTAILLSNEQALAQRILRGKSVPVQFWLWLADRKSQTANAPLAWLQPDLTSALGEIINPMLADVTPHDRSRYAGAAEMIAAMFRFMATQSELQHWAFTNRMMLASLMPLYRGLATGDLHDAMQQTRLALSESFALVGVAYELGGDLDQLIERESSLGNPPHDCLMTTLKLQLNRVARIVTFAGSTWNHADQTHLTELVETAESKSMAQRTADWASPATLWRLAGELMSKKAEFVMPREWINVPVPWGSVSDHWNSLEHLLTKVVSGCEALVESEHAQNHEALTANSCPPTRSADLFEATSAICEDLHNRSISDRTNRPTSPLKNSLPTNPPMANSKSLQIVDSDVQVLDQPQDAGDSVDTMMPKVILGEIRSHNDPVFTNLVSRQLATCRSEDRSVSLLAIRVEPEEEQDRQQFSGSASNGLALWQQKLVNWLADQPEVQDPYAFTSTEGELILCMLDIERNTATSLLRQGLVEMLTGKRLGDDGFAALARVHIPARYHAGIASVSSPGASFAAQQLISACYRCLDAAQRHGKAAIKSIEVF